MDINILKRKNLVAIYIAYEDGYKRQLPVEIHYLDKEVCYLQTDLWDNNITKPKKNQYAEILAYTVNGIYVGKTKILDTNVTLPKLMYTLQLPKKWEYTQTRASARKVVELPFTITYNDGYTINGKSIDISSSGISFALTEPILPVYYNFNAKINVNLLNVADSNEYEQSEHSFNSEAKYLREISAGISTTYVYRFINIDSHNQNILKLYLEMDNV